MNPQRRRLLAGSAYGLAAMFAGGAMYAIAATGKRNVKTKHRVIKIKAEKFHFIPNEIRLKKGELVVLQLSASDFIHGFNLPDMKTRADIVPGRITEISLTPDRLGEFTFVCDNFCGSGHEEMEGKIIVTD
jgi:cytochrome c oxidase subunit II